MSTMTKDKTLRGRINSLERMNSSYYGNPRFRVTLTTEDGEVLSLPTQVDSGWAYGAENREYRENLLEFTLTPSGKVIRYAKVVDDES